MFLGWATVLCIEDNKEYFSMVNTLEREDGLTITESDLTAGNKLVWKYRGVPYDCEVIRIQGTVCR